MQLVGLNKRIILDYNYNLDYNLIAEVDDAFPNPIEIYRRSAI